MEAKELRIGNIVDLYGSIATIQREDFGGKGIAIDKGKPIPLTEEWLIKFGFEKYSSCQFEINNFWSIESIDRGSKKGQFYCNQLECYIQYVHQIQNLYFALTGEELEIKN